MSIEKLAPGVVLIRQALNQENQIFWATYAKKCGDSETNGFYFNINGKKVLYSFFLPIHGKLETYFECIS